MGIAARFYLIADDEESDMTLTTWINIIHGSMAENVKTLFLGFQMLLGQKKQDIIKEWGTSQKVDIDDLGKVVNHILCYST